MQLGGLPFEPLHNEASGGRMPSEETASEMARFSRRADALRSPWFCCGSFPRGSRSQILGIDTQFLVSYLCSAK